MNDNRISCGLGILMAIIASMMIRTTIACTPSYKVTLGGLWPQWVHVDCPLAVDAYATGLVVGSWTYHVYPSGLCDSCTCRRYWPPCGDPPASSCAGSLFNHIGQYTMCVEVMETNPYCGTTKWASDSNTVYAINTALSPDSTCVGVGGPRVRVGITVEPAGPTQNCLVELSLNSAAVTVWDSPTGGNNLLYPNTYRYWAVGAQPSEVWVEGVYGAANVTLQINYFDKWGCGHPTCVVPRTQFKFDVYEARFEAVSAGNTPDLPPGRICTNAQPQYKKAKYRVTAVLPYGEATAARIAGPLDLTLEGITQPINHLVTGSEFWAVGAQITGDYQIWLRHNSCLDAKEEKWGTAFKFKFCYEKYNDDSGSGGQAYINEALGFLDATHLLSDPSGVQNAAFVRWYHHMWVDTEPALAYSDGHVEASAHIDFLCSSLMGITRTNQDGGSPLSVGVSYGILSASIGPGSSPTYGNSLADADTSIRIAGGGEEQLGDLSHTRDQAVKPLLGSYETVWNDPLHQLANDLTRTYVVGSPVDFEVKLSIGANRIDGSVLHGRQNWVTNNHAVIESVEVTDYDGYRIVP